MTIKNLIGSQYGRLTIIQELPRITHNRQVLVQCSCSAIKKVTLNALRMGLTVSCGCYHRDVVKTHGESGDKLYQVWARMRDRCNNPKSDSFDGHGGRGITVCPEWDSYEAFRDWALANGYQEGLSIDREKNDLGYSPGNCRWATPTTQARNRRSLRGSSQYIGVYRCTRRAVWVAQVTVDKKKKTLGLHEHELDAAIARDSYIVNNSLTDFTLNNVL